MTDQGDGFDREALRRKFETIKGDADALRRQIAERATAFSSDATEQRDYRQTLIRLLVGQALQPLYGPDPEDRTKADKLLADLSREMRERTAQRERIKRLLTDLDQATDDAFYNLPPS